MTQFLSRTVVHVLCDWMKVCTFRIIWSNSRGQLRPHQLGHSWIQRPQPTRPQLEQGQLHRPEDQGLRVGAESSRTC